MTDVISYPLDPTGVNPDNLVSNELWPVTTNRVNGKDLIVPQFGYFYTDSVVLKVNGVDVPRDKYKFTEYYHKASLKYGKQICGSILVTLDPDIRGEYSLTYQTLGGDNSRSATNLVKVFYEKLQLPPVEWDNLYNKPKEYPPLNHQHNLSEIHDLGRILTYLENIRDAIHVMEFPEYNTLMKYINEMLVELEARSIQYMNDTMPTLIERFKAQFTKEYFGLDKLVNMACSTPIEGYKAGHEDFKQTDITENKYLTLSSLVMLKEALYQGVIEKVLTNLGTHELRFMRPLRESILNLTTGSNGSYIGQEMARTHSVPFQSDLYPKDTINSKFLSTVKISTHIEDIALPNLQPIQQGTINLGFDHSDYGVWLGSHLTNKVEDPFQWNAFVMQGTFDELVSTMRRHILDSGDPHEVTKEDILLGDVENLPVVPKESILKMKSDRAYVTLDTMLYFMRAFLQINGWHVKLEEGHKYQFLLDNCQVVFSPAGSCGCEPEAADSLVSEFCIYMLTDSCGDFVPTLEDQCGDGCCYEPFPEGQVGVAPFGDLYGVYLRSDNTTYLKKIAVDSPRCEDPR